jgi:hypothetical protein
MQNAKEYIIGGEALGVRRLDAVFSASGPPLAFPTEGEFNPGNAGVSPAFMLLGRRRSQDRVP